MSRTPAKDSRVLKSLTTGLALVALPGLAACASGGLAGAGAAPPPRQVTARAVGTGSAGVGPTTIASPTPVPGGSPGRQQVSLSDRVLTISRIARRPAATPKSVIIDLSVAVRNTSGRGISNQPRYYELMDSGGDVFSAAGKAGSFYGVISGNGSRSGLLQFEVPAAAASSLYLLYRPDNGTNAVLTRLAVPG